MAQIKLSVLAPLIAADAAAIATELNNGVTTANVTALANLLSVLSKRPDVFIPLMAICNSTTKTELKPE